MTPNERPAGATSNDDTEGVPRARVACVDDDTLIREGVSHLVQGVEVVATYKHVEDLLAAAPRVDVVLVDLRLNPVDVTVEFAQGTRAVAAACNAGYRVLIYTNERRRHVLAASIAAGALGVAHKSDPVEDLRDAIHRVFHGQFVITTALAGLAEIIERREGIPRLSPRQVEILRARARGESFKSIGQRLYIAPKTAEEYMAEVSRRFADYLRDHSPADLERLLGIGSGDLAE